MVRMFLISWAVLMLSLPFLVGQIFLELLPAIGGDVHWDGIVEFGVVHQIFASVVSVANQLLEPVAPEDLRWQVRGSGLHCGSKLKG